MAYDPLAKKSDDRVVRVFISSTFRDMQAEREDLVKRVFPQLRKLCDQRGVVWGEVDLRWGITPEEAERGEVLPICLAEIERCRPYFIGLLGERYGWVPDEINPEIIEREAWLAESRSRSVTEMEILHGVLNNPAMADHAFFYFRDPSFVEGISGEKRSDFVESPTLQEIERLGEAEAERLAEDRRVKLAALKDRIRSSSFPLRTDFKDALALGRMVLQDMTEVINRLYPADSIPDPLDREAAEHDAFAQSRARVYIKREAYFERLNAQADGEGPPLVLLGESGAGKSALLANWSLEYRRSNPLTPVILHFIGASSESADWAAMLRRILGELKRNFHFDCDISDDDEQLRSAFVYALAAISEQQRVVIVLDALNQMSDRGGALDLVWLPAEIPVNVRLLVSTLPGRPLDEIQKRDWPTLDVTPLRAPERKKLIGDYLAQYTKKLSAERLDQIAGARQTGNPLYLRALLEELRLFGEHERLADRIDHYLAARTVPALYQKILERCEQDYEGERPNLARDAMSLLWAARRGLTESELMEMLGSGGEPLPRAYWSPLFLATEQSLVSRGGLLGFSHDYLRQAVRSRYLSHKAVRQQMHLRLADYFAGREINQRRIEEQPWQLTQAGAWKRLYCLLSDLQFFEAAWNRNRFDVKACWAGIEEHSDLRVTDAFEPLLERLANWRTPFIPAGWQPTLQMSQLAPGPPPNENQVWGVSELLFDLGYQKEAMRIREWLKGRFEATGDRGALSAVLGGQALILKARGDLDAAYDLFKQQEQISRETGSKESLIGALIGQAQILEATGRLGEAIQLCTEAENLAVETGNRRGLMAAVGNRASVLYIRGQIEDALGLYKQQERIARELENREGICVALGNQALMLDEMGQADEALVLFKKMQRITGEMGDRKGVAASLGYQARVLSGRGDYDTALTLLEDKERICREMGDQGGLATMLHLRADIARKKGQHSSAMECYRQEERIARQFDYQFALFNSLTGQARVHQDAGRFDQALYLLREAESICRESPIQLSSVLRQQALSLKDRHDFDQALSKLAEAERVCTEAENRGELLQVLSNVAAVYLEKKDFQRGLDVFRRAEPLASAFNDQRNMEICRLGIPTCLSILADHFADNGRVTDARRCYSELEARARQMPDQYLLQRALNGQADLLIGSGDVDAALAKLEESERLSRASDERLRLADCLLKQTAMLIDAEKELDKAQTKAQEAATIFDELNMDMQAAHAEALLLRIRAGLTGRSVKLLVIGFMLALASGGVALGLWKTWLWILGGPLAFFAALNLILTLVPSLQRRWNDYVKRAMSDRGGAA